MHLHTMKLYGMNTIELLVFVLYRHFSRKYNFLQKCCQSNNGSKIFDMLRFITMKTSYKIFVDSRDQKYQVIRTLLAMDWSYQNFTYKTFYWIILWWLQLRQLKLSQANKYFKGIYRSKWKGSIIMIYGFYNVK